MAYKFYRVSAHNQIILLCDQLITEITAKFEIPQMRSGLSFKQGVLIELYYRAHYTKMKKDKKNDKGGLHIDHQSFGFCETMQNQSSLN